MTDNNDRIHEQQLRVPKVSPNDHLYLNDDEIKMITTYFNDKYTGTGCEVCGENKWFPFPSLETGTIFDIKNNKHHHGRVIPFVLIGCSNCGNTKRFFANFLGITTPGGVTKGDGK